MARNTQRAKIDLALATCPLLRYYIEGFSRDITDDQFATRT
jgi:hypothetical protein